MTTRTSNGLSLGLTILACSAGATAAFFPLAGIVAAVSSAGAYFFSQVSTKALEERINRIQKGEDPIFVKIARHN